MQQFLAGFEAVLARGFPSWTVRIRRARFAVGWVRLNLKPAVDWPNNVQRPRRLALDDSNAFTRWVSAEQLDLPVASQACKRSTSSTAGLRNRWRVQINGWLGPVVFDCIALGYFLGGHHAYLPSLVFGFRTHFSRLLPRPHRLHLRRDFAAVRPPIAPTTPAARRPGLHRRRG